MTYEDKVELEMVKVCLNHFWHLVTYLATSPPEYEEEERLKAMTIHDEIVAKFEELLESLSHYKEKCAELSSRY